MPDPHPTEPRSTPPGQIPGQLCLIEELALDSWLTAVARSFVFAPLLLPTIPPESPQRS